MVNATFLRGLLLANLALFSAAAILPRIPQGQQFITGACVSDSDCASDCCGFNTGKCAGAVISQQRDGGCGFGDGVPNNRAAQVIQGPNALAAPGVVAGAATPAPAAAAPAAAAPAVVGTQFITGDCANDAACASGCCNGRTGKCAARLVALENNSAAGGCGFGGPGAAPAAAAPAAAPAVVGTQFITGPCANDAACASGCCNARTGLCAARLVAEEFNSRAGGCGFSGAPVARRTVARSVVAKRQGSQFITGPCENDAACASGCCNARTGLCAARLVAEEFGSRAGGCGRGSGAPVAAPVAAAPAAPAVVGTQFITGPCTSDSNCASGCCGFNTGKCAGAIIALERDGGCGFGNAVSNGDAAARLRAGLRR